MELIPDMAERVTAVTDFMMALVAGLGLSRVMQHRQTAPFKINLWSAIYLLLIIAALLGTYHHGLLLSEAAYSISWTLIFLSLGIMIGLLVVAVGYDLFGIRVAWALLPIMIAVALAFFGYSWTRGQEFRLFIMYESAALFSAALGYAYLSFLGKPGCSHMAIGVLLTIIAAAVQTTGAISFTLIVPFDHNANYHLIQIAGVIALTAGILRSVQPDLPGRKD